MKLIRFFLLPLKTSKFIIITSSIILITCYIITSLLIDYYNDNEYNTIDIPSTQLFIIEANEDINLDEFEEIFPLESKNGLDNEIYSTEVKLGYSIYELTPNHEITYELTSKLPEYQVNEDKTVKIYPVYSSKYVIEINMPNQYYNIDYLIAGTYPQQEKQILVGELVAQALLKQENLSDYKSLLGKEFSFKINDENYEYIISGIAAGAKDLYVKDNDPLVRDYDYLVNYHSYYFEFDNETSKDEFLIKYSDDINYLDSNINASNIHKYIFITGLISSTILYIFLIYFGMKNVVFIINYYNKKQSYYLVYAIPLLLYLLVTFIFVSVL